MAVKSTYRFKIFRHRYLALLFMLIPFLFSSEVLTGMGQSLTSKFLSRTLGIKGTRLKASFAYSPRYPVMNQGVQFTDTSTSGASSWQWDFGDGTTSTLQNPVHSYAAVGFYKVALVAAKSAGSKRVIRTVTVMPSSSLSVSFSYNPGYPIAGDAVQFTDQSTGDPTSWEWDFGDGTSSISPNPDHTYAAAGFYRVTLNAANDAGSRSTNRTITVMPGSGPVASFAYSPGSPAPGQVVQFTDTSSGDPISWQWSFGDGATSTTQNPSHTYATAGSKTVTLTVTNSVGSNTTTQTIPVAATIAASFTYTPSSPTTGQTVQFTDTSSGSPTSWQWTFGDGATSTSRNPSHSYARTGSYTVTLTATNSSGSASANRTFTVVSGSSLAASFTYSPTSPVTGQAVQFTDTSTGNPLSWQWSFGDGTASIAQNPSHPYVAAGSYNVTLTVTNNTGSTSTSRTIPVTATLSASFNFTPGYPNPGQTVQFTDASTGSPTSWQWDFGDGSTATVQNPSHAYPTAGSYGVTLVIGDGKDTATVTQSVYVTTDYVIPPDRLIDWTYAGVPGGIPNRTTIYRTFQPGATAAEINAAIAAASGSGQVVYLAAGTYNLNAEIDIASATNVTLRGAGAGRTILNFTSTGSFSIASGPTNYIGAAITGGADISSGYTQGATSITLTSTPSASFRVGNLIQIVQDDDYILVFHRTGNWAGNRNLRHTSRITGVNGNVITFATPIPYSFSAAYRPQANAMPANGRLVGLEDLSVRANGKLAITFGGADRCWVKGVETSGTTNSAIEFRASSQCEVRRCYIHDAYGYPNQDDGYGIFLFYGSGYCRVEDNIGHRMANLVLMNGASGNAILYNFDWAGGRAGLGWITSSINCNHGPHGIMNLFEGNVIARFQNDGYHGSTSHGLLLRNQIHGLHPEGWVQERRLVDLTRGSYFHSVIGNVIGDASWTPNYYELTGGPGHYDNSCIYILGYPNMGNTSLIPATDWENYTGSFPDAKVSATMIRHGNYDHYNRRVVWDNDIVSRTLPRSLAYSSKPGYFGALQWPPIGPDVSGLVNAIPAKARWDAYSASGNIDDLFRD